MSEAPQSNEGNLPNVETQAVSLARRLVNLKVSADHEQLNFGRNIIQGGGSLNSGNRASIALVYSGEPAWQLEFSDLDASRQALRRLRAYVGEDHFNNIMAGVEEASQDESGWGSFYYYEDCPITVQFSRAPKSFRVSLGVPLEAAHLESQFQAIREIYDDITVQDPKKQPFDKQSEDILSTALDEVETAISQEREVKSFIEMVTSALAADPRFDTLAQRLEYSSNNLVAQKLMQLVREQGQSNLRSWLTADHYGDLRYLYQRIQSARQQVGNQNLNLQIPGFSESVSTNDLLTPQFWQSEFYTITESLINRRSLALIHNMRGGEALIHNLQNGIGRTAADEDLIDPDFTFRHLAIRGLPTTPVTWSILALNHQHYSKGASQGGSGDLQIYLDPVRFSGATTFYPYDTGNTDNNLYNPSTSALNIVGATELLLIRSLEQHIIPAALGSSSGTEHREFVSKYIEASTLGRIPVDSNNVIKVVRPRDLSKTFLHPNPEAAHLAEDLLTKSSVAQEYVETSPN